MKEWKDKFNSFNSEKGLTYVKWYEGVANGVFLPPIEASLDPILACNLKCDHCNAHKYLEEGFWKFRFSDDDLLNTVRFLQNWGVKAVCFGGGGEPTMHTALEDAIKLCDEMKPSVATNGVLLSSSLINTISEKCRWVGISVDAANKKTYQIGRKADFFDVVIRNIGKFSTIKNKTCDVCFKFLIFDYNQNEIFEACKLAKSLGVKDFHARPADLSHQGMGSFRNRAKPFNIKKVLKQFEKCHELEDNAFRVFTVVHKFGKDFMPKKNFSQCYAAPCCIQICADRNVYLCPDQRYQEFYKLGNVRDILSFWGGERHKELVLKTGKKNCTTRCTWSPYCEQCERLFINNDDPMCRWFI